MAGGPYMIHKWNIKQKGNMREVMTINSLQHLLWSSAFQMNSAQVLPWQNWASALLGWAMCMDKISMQGIRGNQPSSFSTTVFQRSLWHRIPAQTWYRYLSFSSLTEQNNSGTTTNNHGIITEIPKPQNPSNQQAQLLLQVHSKIFYSSPLFTLGDTKIFYFACFKKSMPTQMWIYE